MMISVPRLATALKSLGFEMTYLDRNFEKRVIFARDGRIKGLFERLNIHCAGKKGEAVPAVLELSVTRRFPGIMGVDLLLMDLATDKWRGYAIIHSDAEAQEWERRFVERIPQAMDELVAAKGHALAERTAETRRKVETYLRTIEPTLGLEQLRTQLSDRATAKELNEVQRLIELPWVWEISGARNQLLYEVAVLTILLSADLVGEQTSELYGRDPLTRDTELMWRIQILVDRLDCFFRETRQDESRPHRNP